MAAGRNKTAGSWAIVLSIGVQILGACSTPSLYGNEDEVPAAQPDPAVILARAAAKFGGRKLVMRINESQIGWAILKEHADVEDIDGEVGAAADQIRIDDATLDRLLFHHSSRIDAACDILRIDMRVRISAIDRICGLTPVQARKLSLAARGDIWRFLEKRDELRQKYQERAVDRRDLNAQLALVRDLSREIERLCRTAETASSRDDTMLLKTMRTCLSAEQKNALLNAKIDPAVPVSRSARFTHRVTFTAVIE
jgi:hypothetical protein